MALVLLGIAIFCIIALGVYNYTIFQKTIKKMQCIAEIVKADAEATMFEINELKDSTDARLDQLEMRLNLKKPMTN